MTSRRGRILKEYGITAGTLGSTSGQTLMVAVLPVLLARYARSAFLIGFAVGGEGIFALLVPYWIGTLSDHLPAGLTRRFGRRTFFLMITAPLMAAALATAPFLRGYWPLAGVAFIFFAALHGYLTPLWALMVDSVPDERRGRVQGVRGVLHSAGLGFGLVASGLLYAIWPPLPFLLGALLILGMTWMTIWAAPPAGLDLAMHEERISGGLRALWADLRQRPAALLFLVSNALWTGAVDGVRPYFFLFGTVVLGITVAQASLMMTLLVVGLAIGSVVIGRLGDRYDRAVLLQVGAGLLGVVMLAGVFMRTLGTAVLLLLGAGVGAAALVALPYPLFAGIVGNKAIGRYTGLYILSVSFGRIFAPMLVGVAIDVGAHVFPQYRGYPFMWPMAGVLTLLGSVGLHFATKRRREAEA